MFDNDLNSRSAQEQYEAAERFWSDRDSGANYKAAVKWFVKSAEHGYAPAQYRLGLLYEQGLGISENPMLAAEWFKRAAQQGHAEAQYRLALCYEKGRGVDRDPAAAQYWYSQAKQHGYT